METGSLGAGRLALLILRFQSLRGNQEDNRTRFTLLCQTPSSVQTPPNLPRLIDLDHPFHQRPDDLEMFDFLVTKTLSGG